MRRCEGMLTGARSGRSENGHVSCPIPLSRHSSASTGPGARTSKPCRRSRPRSRPPSDPPLRVRTGCHEDQPRSAHVTQAHPPSLMYFVRNAQKQEGQRDTETSPRGSSGPTTHGPSVSDSETKNCGVDNAPLGEVPQLGATAIVTSRPSREAPKDSSLSVTDANTR